MARNAGLDRVRRASRQSPLDVETVLESLAPDGDHQAEIAEAIDRSECKDDVLRLMFMCCHPQLKTHEQLALALKVIAGFTVEEIARAFVVTPDTMQRRLSRAKARAGSVATQLETPGLAERAQRLTAVQTMIYLLFNEGYTAAGGDEHIRHALCDEAIRLTRLLLDLFPAQTELMGLLALCLLQHARTPARIDGNGRLVALADQDRSLWDRGKIAEGRVVRLNRAVATAKLHGPQAALDLLQPLATALKDYRPFHAVRAALLEENGDTAMAVVALRAALGCTPTRQEADYLKAKIATLEQRLASG